MPSTDLVRVDQDRQVRSYHRAFAGDLTLYALGKDLRLWRPISARQIFWSAGLVAAAFVFAHVIQLHLPVWSMGWFAYYFIIPCACGWLFARAIIEGRQLHVVLTSWARQSAHGRYLSGGCNRVSRPTPLRKTKIKVEPAFHTRTPSPVWFNAVVVAIVAVLAVVGIGMPLSNARTTTPAHHAVARPTSAPVKAIVTPKHVLVSAPGIRAVRHAAARHATPSPRGRAAAPRRHAKHVVHRAVVHKTVPHKTAASPRPAATTTVTTQTQTPTYNPPAVTTPSSSPPVSHQASPDAAPTHHTDPSPDPSPVVKFKSHGPTK